MALLSQLMDGSDRQFLELSLRLVSRSNALLQGKGWAAPETVAALTAAKQLLDAGVGTDLQRFSVLFGLCFASSIAARMEPALTSRARWRIRRHRQGDRAEARRGRREDADRGTAKLDLAREEFSVQSLAVETYSADICCAKNGRGPCACTHPKSFLPFASDDTAASTLYADRERRIPLSVNSPRDSTVTACSTAINTRGLIRI